MDAATSQHPISVEEHRGLTRCDRGPRLGQPKMYSRFGLGEKRVDDRCAVAELGALLPSTVLAIVLAPAIGYWALAWQRVAESVVRSGGFWAFAGWRPSVSFRFDLVRSFPRFGGAVS